MKASGRGGGGGVIGLSALTAAAAAAALGVGTAWGGPARYDPRTRSIAMTYTYAALAEGVFGAAAIGAPQTPTAEQDASVRTIVLKVSDALSKATAGRLRISSLDLVPDVRRADVVISLSGDPGRGGWAIAGAIEGRPGQIGLYYRTLAKEWEQDYVLTAAHEVCHYVFGFVDEYAFPRGCPPEDPGGPGCLMDNYLSLGTRHGWYGRFCDDDHDPHPTQRQSCQEIADRFFRDRGVTGPADAGTDADPAATPTVIDRNQSIIDQIAHAAVGKVREEAEALHHGRRGGRLLSSISALRGFARSFLEAQLARNGVGLSSDEMGRLVEFVLKQSGRLARVAIPPQFGPLVNVIARFADLRAKQLREKYPRDSELTRRQKLVRALLAFVSGLGASAPTAGGAFTDDERHYLEHVAALAVAEADEPRVDHELYEATLAYVKLQRDTARNVLDIASEVGVVGIERRLAALGEVDADLRKYLPGRTASSGFGLRRTIIVDPDPVDPRDDFVVTQSGIARYADLRDQYVGLFQKLVERARVELLTTELQQRRARERRELLTRPNAERARAERLRRIAELADPDRVRAQREADLRALVDEVVVQVRRNRLENIVFLVPPGGLGTERKSLFETLRRQLIVKADVRLDLVLVGAPDLPFELRDAAVRTGGSVVTLSDVDEVGAVAQRLKNDQTSGCWVIVPQQGVIRGRYRAPAGTPDAAAVPWLLDDPRRGPFLAEPIEPAFRDASLWLEQVDAYFRRPAGAGAASPAEADMLRANVMPRVPVGMLCDAITQALRGQGQGQGEADPARDQAAIGLRGELGYLRELVLAFNHRAPGADELVFEIVEHLIRARSSHLEVKSLLESALKAHQSSLAPDYREDQVFQAAHDRLNGPIPARPIPAAAPSQALVGADPFARVLPLIVEGLEDQADRFVGNAPTLAHIRLRQQEARLRLVDDFLRHIEDELAGSDTAPIFRRIDRKALVLANQRIQDNAPVGPPAGPGAGARRPLPPVDTLDEAGQPRPDAVRLPRFRAEDIVFDPSAEPAEFELILGLARPLPLVDAAAVREHRADLLPELRLYNDDGQLVNTPTLELDRDLSTPTCLVYRFRPEFGETGWYTAALILKDATFSRIGEPIDYTFSVASTRPNVRITAAQAQAPADPELTPPPPNLGLARVSDRRVKLEVQVYGGTSVLGASVRGVLHKLDGQSGPINPIAQDFHDDGKTHGDAKADDGVYTTLIALDQIDQGKEYRVLIQAESTEASRNIPPEDPARNDPARRAEARAAGDPTVRAAPLTEVPTPQPEKALIFQRATSIQVRVER